MGYKTADRRRPWRIWAASALWAALSAYKVAQHLTFNTGAFDLGFRASILYNIAFHGRIWNSLTTGHGFSGHFHPISLALAPLYRVFPSPLLLSVMAAGSVAASFFLYLELADRNGLDRWRMAALAAMFLINPFLHQVLARDFHPEIFAIPLGLLFFVLLDSGRTALATLTALSLLTLKEDMGLLVLALGLDALFRKRWSAGILLTVVGVVWLPLTLLVIMPHFQTAGAAELLSFHYQVLGSSAREVLSEVVSKPWLVVNQVFGRSRTMLTLVLLAASAWPAIIRPESMLALPLLFAHLASDYPHQMDLTWQYSAGILPLLFYATIKGARRLTSPWFWLLIIPAIPAAILRFPDPFPEGVDVAKVRARRALIEMVPSGASISVSNGLASHLVNRPEVVLYPRIGGSEFVLVDLEGNIYPAGWVSRMQDFQDSTSAYQLQAEEQGVFLLRRRRIEP